MQSRRVKLVLTTVVVVLVFGFILTVTRSERSRDLILRIEPIDAAGEVAVYVDGAVENPGLYSLPRGSRVTDALDLAGLVDSSDISGLQMAGTLRDEQSIFVPEYAPEAASVEEVDVPPKASQSVVDINHAAAEELQKLPGVGPAIAERIINHRSSAGLFRSIDELSAVSGISDRMVEEIREHATVNE